MKGRNIFLRIGLLVIYLLIIPTVLAATPPDGPPAQAVPEGTAVTTLLFLGTGLYLIWKRREH